MKRLMLVLAVLGSFPLALSAQVTKEDLRKLASAGLSDEVILNFAKSHGPVAKLTPQDLIELKQAGLKEGVLAELLRIPAPAAQLPSYVQAPAPYYGSSIAYDDVYPGYSYLDYYSPGYSWGWGYPWWGLGVYYGGRYWGGYRGYPYGYRYGWGGYRSGAWVHGSSGAVRVHGGAFGGAHAGGGGHGGHR